MEKKPIMPTLRGMKIGEVELFPLSQYNSVRTSIYTSLAPERAEGRKWEIVADLKGRATRVTRTA